MPVASDGTFSIELPAPPLNRPCVVRAVPGGSTALPSDLDPFTGPRIASGTINVSTVSSGPNGGLSFDFDDDAPQFAGEGDYASVGAGGLVSADPVDPLTFAQGGDLLSGGDYLSDANADRSDLEVDGVPAYASATAEDVVVGAQDFTGLPTLTFSSSQDPTTGDVVVHESELLVSCVPSPATYPASTTSCTSFQSTGVRFDRTIVQDQAGRQVHFTDTYTSVDGKPHTVDLRYGQDFDSADAGFNFPWVDGAAYETHTAGDTIAPPPSSPATVFLKFDNDIPDGDETSAQGAITFAQAPNGFAFLANGLRNDNAKTHLFASFVRDLPAGGSATLNTAFSWAFTQADVDSLAALAVQSFTAPTVATGTASAITTTTATVSASVNANAQPTTYQFQYGTTTSYGKLESGCECGERHEPNDGLGAAEPAEGEQDLPLPRRRHQRLGHQHRGRSDVHHGEPPDAAEGRQDQGQGPNSPGAVVVHRQPGRDVPRDPYREGSRRREQEDRQSRPVLDPDRGRENRQGQAQPRWPACPRQIPDTQAAGPADRASGQADRRRADGHVQAQARALGGAGTARPARAACL